MLGSSIAVARDMGRVLVTPLMCASMLLRQVMAADNEPGDTRATESLDPAHGDASHPGDVTEGFGNLSAEEKNETEAETEREQEPDYNQDQHAPDGHDDEGKTLHAATFAELCTHMTERANFLLEVSKH